MRDVEMKKKNSFKEELNCSEAAGLQERLAEERMRSEVFKEISDLHLKNKEKGPKLVTIVEKIGNQYGISDSSHLFETLKEDFSVNEEYLYQLDEEGYVVADYPEIYIQKMQRQKEQDKLANEKLERYASKAKAVIDRLPQIILQEQFSDEEEVEHGFLVLAIEKAMKTYLEKDYGWKGISAKEEER